MIDQRLAALLWGDADPLGASLRLGSPGSASATVTVVGIARATDFSRPRSDGLLPATPGVYVLSAFDSAAAGTLFVRARGGYAAVAAAVAAAAPGQEVRRLRPVAAVLRAEQDPLRWYARLFGGFAALGLGLAMIGLYGVVGYGTLQRRREFAIRAALGASPRHVVPLVLGQGIWLVGWGTALGALGAFAAVQVIASLLHGAPALSVPTVAGIAAILAAVVLCAYLLPLRQAMGTDPAEAMRAA